MEIRKLNALRGLAALIVAVSHFSNATGAWGSVLGRGAGQLGVMLFFLLSGFLMTHLYWERETTGKQLRAFAVARVARVVPLYLLVVIASFAWRWPYRIPGVPELASHRLFLSGTNVLWTIPTEIQFYVAFALCWYFLRGRTMAIVLLVAALLLAPVFLAPPSGNRQVFGLTLALDLVKALPYFVMGCLFGALHNRAPRLERFSHHAFVIDLAALLLLYPLIFESIFGWKHRVWKDIRILAAMSAVFFTVVFLVPPRNLLLENRLGDLLGRVSYSLYLLHLPVLSFVQGLALPGGELARLAVFLTLSVAVATVSFYAIERPARQWIRAKAKATPALAPTQQRRAVESLLPPALQEAPRHPPRML
jgi:peptidoglycan/LPS O-acetylase OafA/YrhL